VNGEPVWWMVNKKLLNEIWYIMSCQRHNVWRNRSMKKLAIIGCCDGFKLNTCSTNHTLEKTRSFYEVKDFCWMCSCCASLFILVRGRRITTFCFFLFYFEIIVFCHNLISLLLLWCKSIVKVHKVLFFSFKNGNESSIWMFSNVYSLTFVDYFRFKFETVI
jgi:hypothetical protein